MVPPSKNPRSAPVKPHPLSNFGSKCKVLIKGMMTHSGHQSDFLQTDTACTPSTGQLAQTKNLNSFPKAYPYRFLLVPNQPASLRTASYAPWITPLREQQRAPNDAFKWQLLLSFLSNARANYQNKLFFSQITARGSHAF